MYWHIHGVSIGSLLGPALANVFMGFHVKRLLSIQNNPPVYFRYVDDTLYLFNSDVDEDLFFYLPRWYSSSP